MSRERQLDRRPVTIYLPEAVHTELKIEAARRGRTMSDLVLEALTQGRVVAGLTGTGAPPGRLPPAGPSRPPR